MWPSVILSTGLVLLIGCALLGTVVLRKQLRQGLTGFGVLATSDSVLSTMTGTALVGLSLFKEETDRGRSCNHNVTLISASTFLLSFVNSFTSVLLMAVACYAEANTETSEESVENDHKNRRKRRLSFSVATQWILPFLTIAILYQLTPGNIVTVMSRQGSSNDSCHLADMFPVNMATECENDTFVVESSQNTNNLTISVVQRIYELINSSVSKTNPSETISYHLPGQPQTQEEWKNIFLQFQQEQTTQEHRRNKKQTKSPDLVLCDEPCMLSLKKLQMYYIAMVLLMYISPSLGTMLIHRLTKIKIMHHRAKRTQEEQASSNQNQGEDKVCHLKQIKMMVISNFVMWTPTIIELLVKKWLCSSPPQWLMALLFIIGQMNTIVRGLITANFSNYNKPLRKNVILPMNNEPESSIQVLSVQSRDKVETLFQKRED